MLKAASRNKNNTPIFFPFDINFLIGTAAIDTPPQLLAAFAACLKKQGDGFVVDYEKRLLLLKTVLGNPSLYTVLTVGTVLPSTTSWYATSLEFFGVVGEDEIAYVHPGYVLLVMERHNSGRCRGLQLLGGSCGRGEDPKMIAADSAQEKLRSMAGRETTFSISPQQREAMQGRCVNTVNIGKRSLICATLSEEALKRLQDQQLLTPRVFNFYQKKREGSAKKIDKLEIPFASTFALPVAPKQFFEWAHNDQKFFQTTQGICVRPRVVHLVDALYPEAWLDRSEFYNAIVPELYQAVSKNEQVFKAYLRQAMCRIMQLMRADILAERWPASVDVTQKNILSIYKQWFNHIKIDFTGHFKVNLNSFAAEYAAEFGMTAEAFSAFQQELEAIADTFQGEMLGLLAKRLGCKTNKYPPCESVIVDPAQYWGIIDKKPEDPPAFNLSERAPPCEITLVEGAVQQNLIALGQSVQVTRSEEKLYINFRLQRGGVKNVEITQTTLVQQLLVEWTPGKVIARNSDLWRGLVEHVIVAHGGCYPARYATPAPMKAEETFQMMFAACGEPSATLGGRVQEGWVAVDDPRKSSTASSEEGGVVEIIFSPDGRVEGSRQVGGGFFHWPRRTFTESNLLFSVLTKFLVSSVLKKGDLRRFFFILSRLDLAQLRKFFDTTLELPAIKALSQNPHDFLPYLSFFKTLNQKIVLFSALYLSCEEPLLITEISNSLNEDKSALSSKIQALTLKERGLIFLMLDKIHMEEKSAECKKETLRGLSTFLFSCADSQESTTLILDVLQGISDPKFFRAVTNEISFNMPRSKLEKVIRDHYRLIVNNDIHRLILVLQCLAPNSFHAEFSSDLIKRMRSPDQWPQLDADLSSFEAEDLVYVFSLFEINHEFSYVMEFSIRENNGKIFHAFLNFLRLSFDDSNKIKRIFSFMHDWEFEKIRRLLGSSKDESFYTVINELSENTLSLLDTFKSPIKKLVALIALGVKHVPDDGLLEITENIINNNKDLFHELDQLKKEEWLSLFLLADKAQSLINFSELMRLAHLSLSKEDAFAMCSTLLKKSPNFPLFYTVSQQEGMARIIKKNQGRTGGSPARKALINYISGHPIPSDALVPDVLESELKFLAERQYAHVLSMLAVDNLSVILKFSDSSTDRIINFLISFLSEKENAQKVFSALTHWDPEKIKKFFKATEQRLNTYAVLEALFCAIEKDRDIIHLLGNKEIVDLLSVVKSHSENADKDPLNLRDKPCQILRTDLQKLEAWQFYVALKFIAPTLPQFITDRVAFHVMFREQNKVRRIYAYVIYAQHLKDAKLNSRISDAYFTFLAQTQDAIQEGADHTASAWYKAFYEKMVLPCLTDEQKSGGKLAPPSSSTSVAKNPHGLLHSTGNNDAATPPSSPEQTIALV